MSDKKQDWMAAGGFKPILQLVTCGPYVDGFKADQEYQFMRAEWDEPHVLKLSDMHPAMNIANLTYRDIV